MENKELHKQSWELSLYYLAKLEEQRTQEGSMNNKLKEYIRKRREELTQNLKEYGHG
jgi:hypothetical protein